MQLDELPTNFDWDTHDWQQCFTASASGTSGVEVRAAGPGGAPLDRAIAVEDIAEVVAWVGWESDGPNLVAIVRLASDEWAAVNGWADYTGWGCRDGVTWWIGSSREAVELGGLDEFDRERLAGVA